MQTYSEVRGLIRSLSPGYNFRRDWMVLASVGALTIAFLVFTIGHGIMPTPDDVDLYYQYANRILGGAVPYHNFNLEYPPFALPFFIFPAIFSNSVGAFSPTRYILLFQAQSYLLTLGTLYLVWNLLRKVYPSLKINWRIFYFGFSSLLICLYIFRRFDIAATFLVALALYMLYIWQKPGWGGAILGLAAAAKLYPAVLLPVMLIYFWRGKGDREFALRTCVGFVMAGSITTLPFVLSGFPGILEFLKYHSERGVQIESLFASIIWLGSEFGLTNAVSSVDHGSVNFASPWGSTLASLSTLLTVGGLLAFYGYLWWITRSGGRKLRSDWVFQASTIAVFWFIILNKVLSPQYLIWLLPFVVFWRGSQALVYFAALSLSFIAFPFMVLGVVALDWQAMLVILIRNVLLLILFILTVRGFIRISGFPPLLRKRSE
ncbi:MAG: DUF2029 domain-containing protein [Chloroflexi bacterium]|uniref:DUF2029 domain-containing protein n=1 Tax=Candidatus Chlorohelix allophototropha TaxID=3003348 RepID=A0A8T7M5B5_9CHLR|nr:DUF2029 domain-containing protein [Chloroflexota bacterium]WJW69235.1 glycosyltransferase 87 family protein [Chloroflexota bacterium L227-S17]